MVQENEKNIQGSAFDLRQTRILSGYKNVRKLKVEAGRVVTL